MCGHVVYGPVHPLVSMCLSELYWSDSLNMSACMKEEPRGLQRRSQDPRDARRPPSH